MLRVYAKEWTRTFDVKVGNLTIGALRVMSHGPAEFYRNKRDGDDTDRLVKLEHPRGTYFYIDTEETARKAIQRLLRVLGYGELERTLIDIERAEGFKW